MVTTLLALAQMVNLVSSIQIVMVTFDLVMSGSPSPPNNLLYVVPRVAMACITLPSDLPPQFDSHVLLPPSSSACGSFAKPVLKRGKVIGIVVPIIKGSRWLRVLKSSASPASSCRRCTSSDALFFFNLHAKEVPPSLRLPKIVSVIIDPIKSGIRRHGGLSSAASSSSQSIDRSNQSKDHVYFFFYVSRFCNS